MNEKPVRIQRKRTKGFSLQAESKAVNGLPAVSVTRPHGWGNPFKIGQFVTFPETGMVTYWITTAEHATGTYWELKTGGDVLTAYRKLLSRSPNKDYSPLRGKNLACFCKLDAPCHADILLEVANK